MQKKIILGVIGAVLLLAGGGYAISESLRVPSGSDFCFGTAIFLAIAGAVIVIFSFRNGGE